MLRLFNPRELKTVLTNTQIMIKQLLMMHIESINPSL